MAHCLLIMVQNMCMVAVSFEVLQVKHAWGQCTTLSKLHLVRKLANQSVSDLHATAI